MNFKTETDDGVRSVINTSLQWISRKILAGYLQLKIYAHVLCFDSVESKGECGKLRAFTRRACNYCLSPIVTQMPSFCV